MSVAGELRSAVSVHGIYRAGAGVGAGVGRTRPPRTASEGGEQLVEWGRGLARGQGLDEGAAVARRGVGRELLDHLGQVARAERVPALTLTTFTEVPWNAPYHARCGFHPMTEGVVGPQLRAVRAREAAHGLDRRPRVCMRRAL